MGRSHKCPETAGVLGSGARQQRHGEQGSGLGTNVAPKQRADALLTVVISRPSMFLACYCYHRHTCLTISPSLAAYNTQRFLPPAPSDGNNLATSPDRGLISRYNQTFKLIRRGRLPLPTSFLPKGHRYQPLPSASVSAK